MSGRKDRYRFGIETLDRRDFLRRSVRVGAGLALVPGLLAGRVRAHDGPEMDEVPKGVPNFDPPSVEAPAALPDLSVVTGADVFASTLHAIELLGGMGRYIKSGDRVALLPNAWNDKPGTYTRPELALAVAQACYDAGAKQVVTLKDESDDYWDLCLDRKKHEKLIARIKPADSGHRTIEVKGKLLRKAKVLEAALDYERVINLPIVKDHSGCSMTGCLKNMMGLTHFHTNMAFHLGPNPVTTFLSSIGDMFTDLNHFGQCVADLNVVRRADLCVMDATEFITTNGPGGPGKLARPDQVIAGTDPVAIDALCAPHLGLEPKKVHMIVRAHASGHGQLDPKRLNIRRATLG